MLCLVLFVCVVLFFFVLAECFWDFVCKHLSVCLSVLFCHIKPYSTFNNSAHQTISDLPNVQRQNTDVYFSCYDPHHL